MMEPSCGSATVSPLQTLTGILLRHCRQMAHLGSELTSKDTDVMHVMLPRLFPAWGEGKGEKREGRVDSGSLAADSCYKPASQL